MYFIFIEPTPNLEILKNYNKSIRQHMVNRDRMNIKGNSQPWTEITYAIPSEEAKQLLSVEEWISIHSSPSS